MLFSKAVHFAVAVAAFGATLSQAKLAEGKYRIWSGDQPVRTFHSSAHQGPVQMAITLSDQPAGTYEQWDVTASGNKGYILKNPAAQTKAYAIQKLDSEVLAASDEETVWQISEVAIHNEDVFYVIRVPGKDLVWTTTPVPGQGYAFYLEHSDGSAAQQFMFQPIKHQ